MHIHKSRSNSHACGEQVAGKATTGPQYQQVELALDVHAASIVVGRMIDGAKPQPPQTFNGFTDDAGRVHLQQMENSFL